MIRMRHGIYKSGQALAASECSADPDERCLLGLCRTYTQRLLQSCPLFTDELLDFLAGILGQPGLESAGRLALRQVPPRDRRDLENDLVESRLDPDSCVRAVRRIVNCCRTDIRPRLVAHFIKLLKKREKSFRYDGRADLDRRVLACRKMFHLDPGEAELLRLLLLLGLYPPAESFFVDHLECQTQTGRRYLRAMLGVGPAELARLLHSLSDRAGLVQLDRHRFGIHEDFTELLYQPLEQLAPREFFTRAGPSDVPLEAYQVEPPVLAHLLALLGTRPATSTHVLLYGPPGTGKTSFARALARRLKTNAWEIMDSAKNTTERRRVAIGVCQNLTGGGPGSLILVDEADNLLNTRCSWFLRGETQDKGWLNRLLEQPGARMIWIVNTIEDIEPSVLRRFAYSLPFRQFSRVQRQQLWRSVLKANRAGRRLGDPDLQEFARRYKVSAGVIDLAVKKARETAPPGRDGFRAAVVMALEAHRTLARGGDPPDDKERVEAAYSLEGLHVDGDLPALLKQLEAFDRFLRAPGEKPARSLNLLFHGPPGTGKSELARHLAGHLGRELMVRRASDLLDPFVGMTERHIAAAFAEAEREGAVLVLDEADSFLFPRGRARRSWEISFTNELLTRLERFRGILVCTTNRLTGLDDASLRRFTAKVAFDYLTPDGAVVFYRKLLAPLVAAAGPAAGISAASSPAAAVAPSQVGAAGPAAASPSTASPAAGMAEAIETSAYCPAPARDGVCPAVVPDRDAMLPAAESARVRKSRRRAPADARPGPPASPGGDLNAAAEAFLRSLPRLAPGDFRVVRDRFAFHPPEEVTPTLLLAALAEESRLKSAHAGLDRKIGF